MEVFLLGENIYRLFLALVFVFTFHNLFIANEINEFIFGVSSAICMWWVLERFFVSFLMEHIKKISIK